MKTYLALVIGAALAASNISNVEANTLLEFQKAVADGNTEIALRYRYEFVEQDGIDKDANASTLRTRLAWTSADFNGFFTKVEVDNITATGNENYNSTVNGNGQYPAVVDPTGTDLNQAFIGYKTGNTVFSFGRQRINHNDERFVGGVGWRQNEQTFDGYRVVYDDKTNLSFDVSYVYNVNRIFGSESAKGDLDGKLVLANANYKLDKNHKLTGFMYNMDFNTALALSNRTLGVSYDGKVSSITIHASYATQTDTGDNPVDYSADYWALELSKKVSAINLALGFESLGSDNDTGFITPLATLHKFQGFADKFLATPDAGVNDLYVKASGKWDSLGLTAVYHKLDSVQGSIDYGTELNLVATYPLAKKVGLLVKYANYSADDLATDTSKAWAMLNFKF